MALKSYKPTTPGQRGLVLIDRSELWKGRPVKSLTEGLTGKGGRNNTGRITMRRRGGGVKRLYRIVDFRRTKFDVPAKVIRIECRKRRLGKVKVVFSDEQTLPPLQEEIEEAPTAARRTVPASNAFVPAGCGLVCGSEVVKDLLRKAGVYRGKK